MCACLHVADIDVHRACGRGKRASLEAVSLIIEPVHVTCDGGLLHRLITLHDEIFRHLRTPHSSVVLHAYGERVQSLFQSFDVDDVYRVLLIQSHYGIHVAVNPVLMLNYLLFFHTDFGIRLDEVLGHLRTPHSGVVLHAHGKRVQTRLQSFDVDESYRVALSHLSLQFAVNPVLVLHYLLVADADFSIRLDEVLGHLRTPHSGIVLHAHGKRVQTRLQSFDVDESYRVTLSHLCLQFAVNPVLVLHYFLVANADFGIRLDEAFCHLRTPCACLVLHAYCERVEACVQRRDRDGLWLRARSDRCLQITVNPVLVLRYAIGACAVVGIWLDEVPCHLRAPQAPSVLHTNGKRVYSGLKRRDVYVGVVRCQVLCLGDVSVQPVFPFYNVVCLCCRRGAYQGCRRYQQISYPFHRLSLLVGLCFLLLPRS